MKAPEESEFKGHPVLTIYTGREYLGKEERLTIGVRKAAAICDNIDYIRMFVEKHESKGKE